MANRPASDFPSNEEPKLDSEVGGEAADAPAEPEIPEVPKKAAAGSSIPGVASPSARSKILLALLGAGIVGGVGYGISAIAQTELMADDDWDNWSDEDWDDEDFSDYEDDDDDFDSNATLLSDPQELDALSEVTDETSSETYAREYPSAAVLMQDQRRIEWRDVEEQPHDRDFDFRMGVGKCATSFFPGAGMPTSGKAYHERVDRYFDEEKLVKFPDSSLRNPTGKAQACTLMNARWSGRRAVFKSELAFRSGNTGMVLWTGMRTVPYPAYPDITKAQINYYLVLFTNRDGEWHTETAFAWGQRYGSYLPQSNSLIIKFPDREVEVIVPPSESASEKQEKSEVYEGFWEEDQERGFQHAFALQQRAHDYWNTSYSRALTFDPLVLKGYEDVDTFLWENPQNAKGGRNPWTWKRLSKVPPTALWTVPPRTITKDASYAVEEWMKPFIRPGYYRYWYGGWQPPTPIAGQWTTMKDYCNSVSDTPLPETFPKTPAEALCFIKKDSNPIPK